MQPVHQRSNSWPEEEKKTLLQGSKPPYSQVFEAKKFNWFIKICFGMDLLGQKWLDLYIDREFFPMRISEFSEINSLQKACLQATQEKIASLLSLPLGTKITLQEVLQKLQ